MPRGDRTGPRGEGPETGRRAGYCAGHEVPGNMNAKVPPRGGGGRGGTSGRGRRGGRYRRHQMVGRRQGGVGRVVPVIVETPRHPTGEEVTFLETYANEVMEDLRVLRERIDQLKGEDPKAE